MWLKNDLFGLKFWVQRFFDMGYRMSIVTLEFEISPYDMNPGWAGGLSLKDISQFKTAKTLHDLKMIILMYPFQ